MVVRCFLDLSYDGTAYHGWQRQPESISVQQVLEEKQRSLDAQRAEIEERSKVLQARERGLKAA